VCQEQHRSGPVVAGQTDVEDGTAGTVLSPADDDLALRAGFYGLLIQSYVDKVCNVILHQSSNTFIHSRPVVSIFLSIIWSIFYKYLN